MMRALAIVFIVGWLAALSIGLVGAGHAVGYWWDTLPEKKATTLRKGGGGNYQAPAPRNPD